MTATRVRVVVPLDSQFHGDHLVAQGVPGLEIDVARAAAGAPMSLEAAYSVAQVEQDVVDQVIEAQAQGAAAVVTRCMRDVGVTAAREVVSIPVVGPARASMHLAALLGRRFSVLVTLPRSVQVVEDQVRGFGLTSRFASARPVGVGVVELQGDREDLVARMVAAGRSAVLDDGAHVLILGCTTMQGAGEAVRRGLSALGLPEIPVVEPLAASVRLAAVLAELGLSHSRRTYPQAEPFIRQARGLPPYPETAPPSESTKEILR